MRKATKSQSDADVAGGRARRRRQAPKSANFWYYNHDDIVDTDEDEDYFEFSVGCFGYPTDPLQDFTVKEQRRFETERINSARDNLRADEEQAAEPTVVQKPQTSLTSCRCWHKWKQFCWNLRK